VSKYIVFKEIVFKDRELLLAALADIGYARIEEGEALPLYGYRGDRRTETAQIAVRRAHLGFASNDLGFARIDAGYVPIISEYDRRALRGGRLLPELRAAYAERVVERVRNRLRGSARRVTEGSVTKIRVRF